MLEGAKRETSRIEFGAHQVCMITYNAHYCSKEITSMENYKVVIVRSGKFLWTDCGLLLPDSQSPFIAEEAKASLPDEFDKDWVMTVQQSKGLEFDDVLLYDFFSHSPAKDAWRVVTNYTESGT